MIFNVQYTAFTKMATTAKTNSTNNSFGVKPKDYIYEDDTCFVFDELSNPQAPIHYVVVPKKNIPRLCAATDEDEKILGRLLLVAKNIAIRRGLHHTGYHVVVDEDHRAVKLKSLHVFGRALQHMLWPLGPGARL